MSTAIGVVVLGFIAWLVVSVLVHVVRQLRSLGQLNGNGDGENGRSPQAGERSLMMGPGMDGPAIHPQTTKGIRRGES